MKNPKKLWELICYFGGILGFILASTLSSVFAGKPNWGIVFTVLQILFMAAICTGCVLGIIRTRKFCTDNLLRGAVLIAIGTDLVLTAVRLFS